MIVDLWSSLIIDPGQNCTGQRAVFRPPWPEDPEVRRQVSHSVAGGSWDLVAGSTPYPVPQQSALRVCT